MKHSCVTDEGWCGKDACVGWSGMRRLMDDVAEFHEMVDQPVLDVPTVPSKERIELRASLMEEEFHEVMNSILEAYHPDCLPKAREQVDLIALADGLADLTYVIIGTALEFGIPLDKVWAEVQRSNMMKGVNGVVVRAENGKILKPEDWVGPDIEGCLK